MDLRKTYRHARLGISNRPVLDPGRGMVYKERPALDHAAACAYCHGVYEGKSPERFAQLMAECENDFKTQNGLVLMPEYPHDAALIDRINYVMAAQDVLYKSPNGSNETGQRQQQVLVHFCGGLICELEKQEGRENAVKMIYREMCAKWDAS